VVWGRYVRAFLPLSWASFEQQTALYPTLYGYAVGLAAVALDALGVLATAARRHQLFRPPPEAFLVARGVAAAASIATVALVGMTAARLYSRRVGLAAAALAAVAPFEVVYAHVASPDVPLATLTVLTLYLAWRIANGAPASAGTAEPRRALAEPTWAAAAGLAAGAATGTKYTGLALTVPVAWAVAERALARRSWRVAATLAVVAGLGFAAGAALACPPCVLHADRVLAAMRSHLAVNTDLYAHLHNAHLAPALGWYGRPYAYQLVAAFPFVLGWPLYALSLVGVAVAAWRRERADRIILATIVPYFLVMAGSMVVYPRYLLPLLPALVILGARAATLVRARRVRLAVLAAVWIYALAFGASQVARFSLDQQEEVARWIATAARREGFRRVRVGVPKMVLDYYRLAAPLAAARLTRVELADGVWFTDPPEFFVLPEWYEIAIERDMPAGPAARDLARLRSGAAGYREAARWRSWYLQRRLYTRLDPAFAGDLWQGEIGFSVWVREVGEGAGRDRARAPAAPTPTAASPPR
jgi:hypothetical protein